MYVFICELICTIITHLEIHARMTHIQPIPLHPDCFQDDVEMQHADVDLDEAEEHGADPDLETDEATPEAAQIASVTSLLSKPGREAEAEKIEKGATPMKTQKHMEKHASKQTQIAGGHEDKERQKKVKIEKHLQSSKKASHKDGASKEKSSAELKNSTKTSSEDSEKMGRTGSNSSSDVLGTASPNSSFMGQNDTKIQSNTSAETGDAETPNSTGATNAMQEADSQLKKVQERLLVEKLSSTSCPWFFDSHVSLKGISQDSRYQDVSVFLTFGRGCSSKCRASCCQSRGLAVWSRKVVKSSCICEGGRVPLQQQLLDVLNVALYCDP